MTPETNIILDINQGFSILCFPFSTEQPRGPSGKKNMIRKSIRKLRQIEFAYCHNQKLDDPVLFIHGAGSDHSLFSWKKCLPVVAQTRGVISPDLPGYGDSPWPAQPPAGSPLKFYREVLLELLDDLGLEQVSLVGVSMGGAIALSIALDNPGRVDKLVLVSSYGLSRRMPRTFLAAGLFTLPGVQPCLRGLVRRCRGLVQLGMRYLVEPPARGDQELIDDAWETVRRRKEHPAWEAFLKNEITRSGYRTSFEDRLEELRPPTLLINGDRDRLIPLIAAQQAAEQIPKSRLLIYRDCGHLPPREFPEQFNQDLLAFLDVSANGSG